LEAAYTLKQASGPPPFLATFADAIVIAPPEPVAEVTLEFLLLSVYQVLSGFEPVTDPLLLFETPVVKSKIETTAAFAEPATAAAATALHIPRLKRLLRIFDSLGHCPEQQPTSHVGQ
jgi:hypothetical protein